MSELDCRYNPRPEPTDDQRRGENREDFMKRWFAIALSVGFATALSRMPWISEGLVFKRDLPVDIEQINQLFRLFAAATATLLSWEGYLSSIRSKPLTDGKRFYIDVLLVTLYLVLLLTSASPYFWIWIHCLTFGIYMFWDRLSIAAYPNAYIYRNSERYPTRSSIYKGAISGNPDLYHGPLVTLVWPIYFLTVASTYQWVFRADEKFSPVVTVTYFMLVLFGLLRYREDKFNKTRPAFRRLSNVAISSAAVVLASILVNEIDQPIRSFIGF